jgi:GGDEF domain-containing protein
MRERVKTVNAAHSDGSQCQSQLFHQLHGLLDWNNGWYQKWYFMLRLEEEVLRSIRYHHPFAVLSITLETKPHDKAGRQELDKLLAELAFDGFRETDIQGVLNLDELAVILPETDRAGAEIVSDRLAGRLAPFAPRLGVALFPSDGGTAEELLEHAQAWITPPVR